MLAKIIWFYIDFHWDISILVTNSKHFFENLHIFANIWKKGQNQKLKPFVIQNHTRKRRICCQIFKIFFGSNVSIIFPYHRAIAECIPNNSIYLCIFYAHITTIYSLAYSMRAHIHYREGPVIWVKNSNIWTKIFFKNLTSYSSFSGMILYYKRSQFFILDLGSYSSFSGLILYYKSSQFFILDLRSNFSHLY